MDNEKRTIPIGLYSDYALTMVESLLKQMKCEYGRKFTKLCDNSTMAHNPDYEVVIENRIKPSYNWEACQFDKMAEDQKRMRTFLAAHLKKFVTARLNSKSAWNRKNDECEVRALDYFDTTHPNVAEVYFVYDTLLKRKNLTKRYTQELIEKMTGQPNDPVKTELETAKRQALVDAEAEMKSKLAELGNRKRAEIEAYTNQKQEEYAPLLREVKEEYAKKVKMIEEMAKISSTL